MRVYALLFVVFLATIQQYRCQDDTTHAAVEATEDKDWNPDIVYGLSPKKNTTPQPETTKSPKEDAKKIKSPDFLGHINIYIKGSPKPGKAKAKRFRFPVARYDRRRFPPFGPLLNFLPWIPIYVEPRSKQTIIYSPTGGVYILPPVVNFYGELYSVGELIVSGYASLVSTGTSPTPSTDVAPMVQPGAVVGPGIPTVDPTTGGFSNGVQTNIGTFSNLLNTNSYAALYNAQQQAQYARMYNNFGSWY